MKQNTVVVYVGEEAQSEAFAQDTNTVVYGAETMRDALAQTIFTYPDAIVINAADNMLRAEDSFFHLRTINHPPIVLLSNMPWRWETKHRGKVAILPEGSDHQTIMNTVLAVLMEAVKTPC